MLRGRHFFLGEANHSRSTPSPPAPHFRGCRSAERSQFPRNRHIEGMRKAEQCSDTDLLLAARTCAEPFGVFYERHFASVLAFFRRRVPGPEEAFDLAAE